MKYQLCPKCNGQGSVSKPPYVPGDVHQWTSSATSFLCDVCNGAKVLLLPEHPLEKLACDQENLDPKISSIIDDHFEELLA